MTAVGHVRSRRVLIAVGALSMLLGAIAILVPAVASVGTAVFIGIMLLCAAVPLAFNAFAGHDMGVTVLRLLLALVTGAAGLYLLVAPLEGTYTLTVMLVIWFVAVGCLRIAGGLGSLGVPGAGLTVINGAVSLVLGILIAKNLPSSADWAIGLLVGIDLFLFGASALWAASSLKDEQAGTAGLAAEPVERVVERSSSAASSRPSIAMRWPQPQLTVALMRTSPTVAGTVSPHSGQSRSTSRSRSLSSGRVIATYFPPPRAPPPRLKRISSSRSLPPDTATDSTGPMPRA